MDNRQIEAKNKISNLNISYTTESFLEHVNNNNIEVVKLFLQAGMSPNVINYDISPDFALIIAAKKGYIPMLRLLLKNNEEYAGTAVIFAIRVGQETTVKEIINEIIDINEKGCEFFNAQILASAASGGHLNIVKFLLEKGIDINIKDFKYYDKTALMAASFYGAIEVVKFLIEAGADLNLCTTFGETALMEAAQEGEVEIIKLLIKAGAILETKNREGKTALILAQENGHNEIAQLLSNATKGKENI